MPLEELKLLLPPRLELRLELPLSPELPPKLELPPNPELWPELKLELCDEEECEHVLIIGNVYH